MLEAVWVGTLFFLWHLLILKSIIVQRCIFAKWVRPQALDLGSQLGGGKGKLAAHGRGQVDHLDALPFQPDALEQLANVFDSSFSFEITFQVMTIAFQSAGHHYAVGAILERTQGIQHVELAGAGQLDDFD